MSDERPPDLTPPGAGSIGDDSTVSAGAAEEQLGQEQPIELPAPSPQEVVPPRAGEPEVLSPGARKVSLPEIAPTLALLSMIGVSLVLFAQTISLPHALETTFLSGNKLPSPRGRLNVLLSVLAGALFPQLVVLGLYIWKRARIVPGLERTATLLGPLALLFVVPALFNYDVAQANALQYLMILSGFVFALRKLVERSLEVWAGIAPRLRARFPRITRVVSYRPPRWVPLLGVFLAACGYTVYCSFYTILHHRQIQTTAFDLGIFDNLMFNALAGRPFRSPVMFGPGNYNSLSTHSEYLMLLFVPFYAIKPGAETLLILQSAFMGLAAVPLFLAARTRVSQGIAFLLSMAYLLFAPLHGPNFYDFHWLPLGVFFHFWLYYALGTRKNWLAILMIVLLFLLREDIAVGLAVLGLFLFLTRERALFGFVLSVVSVIWFVVNKFVLMRLAGEWWFENMYAELFADGKPGYGSVIVSLATNPVYSTTTFLREAKLVYALHMIAPLAFLPLRRPILALLLLPGCVFTLMTTGYWPTVTISFQYTTHWIPYLFLATTLGIWMMSSEPGGEIRRKAAMFSLVVALLSHSYSFGAILQNKKFVGGFFPVNFEFEPWERKRYADLMTLVRKIPPDASVLATEFLSPHVSARKESYVFRYNYGTPDYILLSTREVVGDIRKMLNETFKKKEYGLVGTTGNEFYLLKRDLVSPDTKKALKALGLAVPKDKDENPKDKGEKKH